MIKKTYPPRPPQPPDRPQNPMTPRPFGKTTWIRAHWRWEYNIGRWEWVTGHWAR